MSSLGVSGSRAVLPVLMLAVFVLTGCSRSATAGVSAASATSAAVTSAAPAASPESSQLSCAQQVKTWGGAGFLSAVVADVGMVGGAAITDAVQGHVTNTARQDVVTLDAAVSHAATSPIPSCADHSGWYARTLLGARKIAADVSDHRSPAVIGADLKRAHEALENAEAELKAGK